MRHFRSFVPMLFPMLLLLPPLLTAWSQSVGRWEQSRSPGKWDTEDKEQTLEGWLLFAYNDNPGPRGL